MKIKIINTFYDTLGYVEINTIKDLVNLYEQYDKQIKEKNNLTIGLWGLIFDKYNNSYQIMIYDDYIE